MVSANTIGPPSTMSHNCPTDFFSRKAPNRPRRSIEIASISSRELITLEIEPVLTLKDEASLRTLVTLSPSSSESKYSARNLLNSELSSEDLLSFINIVTLHAIIKRYR